MFTLVCALTSACQVSTFRRRYLHDDWQRLIWRALFRIGIRPFRFCQPVLSSASSRIWLPQSAISVLATHIAWSSRMKSGLNWIAQSGLHHVGESRFRHASCDCPFPLKWQMLVNLPLDIARNVAIQPQCHFRIILYQPVQQTRRGLSIAMAIRTPRPSVAAGKSCNARMISRLCSSTMATSSWSADRKSAKVAPSSSPLPIKLLATTMFPLSLYLIVEALTVLIQIVH